MLAVDDEREHARHLARLSAGIRPAEETDVLAAIQLVCHRRPRSVDTGGDVEHFLTFVSGIGREPAVNGDVKHQICRC